jgi:hypothetical protein
VTSDILIRFSKIKTTHELYNITNHSLNQQI